LPSYHPEAHSQVQSINQEPTPVKHIPLPHKSHSSKTFEQYDGFLKGGSPNTFQDQKESPEIMQQLIDIQN
jgi:hypothetical protein